MTTDDVYHERGINLLHGFLSEHYVDSAVHRVRVPRQARDRSAPGHGLSSSRFAVQANGGEVHAHNPPGKGCIFGIQLPVAASLDAGA